MAETSHDARSGIFFTVDGAHQGWWYAEGVRALSAAIIKYLRNKGMVLSACMGTVARRCVTLRLKLNAFLGICTVYTALCIVMFLE